MISKPEILPNGSWAVNTRYGVKIFSDGETAYDFYLINKYIEEQKSNGNQSDPR